MQKKGERPMQQESKELRTIDWEVYKILKENSQIYMHQQTIIDFLKMKGIDISKRELRKSIRNLKDSPKIQKIILTSYSNGYKLLTDEKERELLEKKTINILKQLALNYKDIKRFNLNSQSKIPVSKYERNFIESIMKGWHYEM